MLSLIKYSKVFKKIIFSACFKLISYFSGWHLPFIAHPSQLQPQEDFPFLRLIMPLITISRNTAKTTVKTNIVGKFNSIILNPYFLREITFTFKELSLYLFLLKIKYTSAKSTTKATAVHTVNPAPEINIPS